VEVGVIARALGAAGRHPGLALAVLAAAAAFGGLAVAAAGVIPLRASAGHWAVTNWLLHFAMERSVVTHSLLIEAPPLDDPARAIRGATHYERGCRSCHGSVLGRTPRVAEAMLPPPPYLPPRVSRWSPEQLFYIVKHGIKFTGMPAWPAPRRDDEVWDVVAFLLALPRLDAGAYRELTVGGSNASGGGGLAALPRAVPERGRGLELIRDACASCHGLDGAGRDGAFPVLAGQQGEYMTRALHAYHDGRRHSGVMEPVAASLSDSDVADATRYYAGLPRRSREAASSAASIARGRALAARGVRSRRIPACIECHGPSAVPTNPAYPILAGQPAGYLRQQLLLLQQGRRGGSEYAHLMQPIARRLRAEEIADLAEYFSSVEVGAARE
jgi:cytochrome c553